MPYGLWLLIGGLLVIAEALAPGFVLLWFGVAALVTGGLVFFAPDLAWPWQFLCFGAVSLASLLLWFQLRPKGDGQDGSTLNRRGNAMIGKLVTLETAIKNGTGSARIGDGVWTVRGVDTPAGTVVQIVASDGAVLEVAPATRSDSEPAH